MISGKAIMTITGTTLDYDPKDQYIVSRLGWAVIKQWLNLPEEIRQTLIDQAVMTYDLGSGAEPVQLAQKIEVG